MQEKIRRKLTSDINKIIRKGKIRGAQKSNKNIKTLQIRKKVIKLFNDHPNMEKNSKAKYGEELKILIPKQILQGLSMNCTQVKAGNTSENLLNENRQIMYSL